MAENPAGGPGKILMFVVSDGELDYGSLRDGLGVYGTVLEVETDDNLCNRAAA